ncbi:FG-GAP-like repeat-containing protein, partial [[Eubacterium] cellulosolvens]
WGPKTTLSVGNSPRSVYVADANNDTYNDILTANRGDDTITIYNGTFSGGWEPKYNLSTGDGPVSVFVGDANNDGYNDTLTADSYDHTVTIYNGTSSGTWDTKFNLSVGQEPWSVFIGDANTDGYNDIATADFADDAVSIYGGTSSGTWEPRIALSMGNNPYSVFIGNVNDYILEGAFPARNAETIITGNAPGDNLGHSVSSAGDMNGDGYDDMIVGAYGENKSYIYFGDLTNHGTEVFVKPETQGIVDDTGETSTDDLKIDDDANVYDAPKGKTLFLDSFNTSGLSGTVTSVILYVQYKTDTSYTPDRNIEWAMDGQTFLNTTIQVQQSSLEVTPSGYDLYQLGVNNLTEIQTLDIRFYNNDTGGQCGVYFDYIWLEVKTKSPKARLMLNGTGDFGWSVADAGDVNGDSNSDILIGAPDVSGVTPGMAYVKYGDHQGFDEEAIGDNPIGWTQISPAITNANISDNASYGSSGNSVEFNYAGSGGDLVEIEKSIPLATCGVMEFCARTSITSEWPFFIRMVSSSNGNETWLIGLGHESDPYDFITYGDGDGSGSYIQKRIQKLKADTWYHFKIIYDCDLNTYDIYINGIPEVHNARYVDDNTIPDKIEIRQRAQSGTAHIEFVDEIVWLGSNLDITLTGVVNGDQFGYSVSGAGDFDNDGYDDIIIGAPFNDSADGQNADAGAIYIFNGSSGLSDNNANNADNISYGENANDHFGWSVSRAGDVNYDGWNDVIVGTPDFDNNTDVDAGRVYVMTYHVGATIPEFPIIGFPLFFILILIAIFRKRYYLVLKRKIKNGVVN